MRSIIITIASVALAQQGLAAPQGQDERPRRERPGFQDRQNQQRGGASRGGDPFDRSPQMKTGETISGWDDLAVHELSGCTTALKDLVPSEGRLVIVNGCLTCPKFLRSYSGVEAVARDYAQDDNTRFIYLYKTLAHPENNGYVQAFTLEERITQAQAAEKQLRNTIPFYVDGMNNAALKALGNSPNSQVVVDSNGTILHARGWSEGDALRTAMIEIAGPTETTTSADQLGLPAFRGVTRPAGNVVARVRPTEALTPLRLQPDDSKEPHFVKLRAEVGRESLAGSGSGESELYLGFHLDPVHDVHWNNLVDPIAWSIAAPEGVTITPSNGTGPEVKAATDTDPREFLASIEGWQEQGPLTVTVTYFACSDGGGDEAKAFCRKIEQTYTVHRERDRAAGMVQSRTRGPGGGRGEMARGQDPAERMMRMDADGDGRISAKEAAGTPLESRFEMMDRNGDGVLDDEELQQMRQRMRNRGGNRRGGSGNSRRPPRNSPPI